MSGRTRATVAVFPDLVLRGASAARTVPSPSPRRMPRKPVPDYRFSAFADELGQDPEEQVRLLAQMRIGEIQLRSAFGKNVMALSDVELAEIRAVAEDAGLGFHAIASPLGKVSIEAPEAESLDGVRRAADAAAVVGCDRVRIFSFYREAGQTPEDVRGRVIERLAAMCRIARERGVTLVHENEAEIYGETARRCRDLADALPDLALAFDFANFVLAGQDTWSAWELLHDRVLYFDIKDADLVSGQVTVAGKGDGQMARILADALWRGYRERFNLEPHLATVGRFGGTTTPEQFQEAVDALHGLLNQVGPAWPSP